MGCILSKMDVEERMGICRERKRLMKQLVGFRGEFANAQMAYLRALKNTGVTLRQLTESESLELEATTFGLALPPSPPPPLPPSPPPPPVFSPDLRKFYDDQKAEAAQEEIVEIDEDNDCTPPPPPVPNSTWDFWDPFCPSSPYFEKNSETVEPDEEEHWVEANTDFEEDNQEAEVEVNSAVNKIHEKPKNVELIDDNSSIVSWHTKDTTDRAMVVWRSKKTFAGIVKELDDYFLKASAGGREIAIFMDINVGDTFLFQNSKENNRKRYNSSKVFSALTWNWTSKSQLTRHAVELYGRIEPCTPGAHCITLAKLYTEEQKLYKQLKEEEVTKLELEKKSLLLQKEEDENHDWAKTDKTRLNVETLQSNIIHLQQSISSTCSSILKLIDDELHPQLIALTSGLMRVWRTMYQCHEVQNHISQQLNHICDQETLDPTTDYHRQAAAQLKTEVTSWYNIFCKLIRSQQDYVKTLCRWLKLTDCLMHDCQRSCSSSALFTLCEEWQHVIDRLPDKVPAEAIKNLLSAIQSLILQQQEELNLKKKSDKLEKKLQRVLKSLAEMETKLEGSITIEDAQTVLGPKHPLSVKRAKIEVLRKQVDDEKAKYQTSVRVTQTMTLNNLKTSLPNVFQALSRFSSACTQSLEAVLRHARPAEHSDESLSPTC